MCVGANSAVVYYDQNQLTKAWSNPYVLSVAAGGQEFEAVAWPDTDFNRVLAVGQHGLFAWSNNNGLSWTVGDTGDDIRWFDLDGATSTSAFAAGTFGRVAQLTFNSGPNTWSYSDPGPTGVTNHLRAISTRWDDHIWAGGDSGVYIERALSTSTRAADADRYSTAIAMSSDWPDDSCDTVVLATGRDFPDALSASALAGTYECPLLLTGTTLRDDVKAEIERLGASTVVIVGGTSAVSQVVQDALPGGVVADRIAGDNRYHTAELVARKIAAEEGDDFTHQAFIARGDGFADALAVSPFAYSQKIPVLLTKTTSLPGNTQLALTDLNIDSAALAGGESAVSSGVKSSVDAILVGMGGSASERWWGQNRYETAATVARNGIEAGWGTTAFVGLATGLNFPDALGGGAVCGSTGGVLLLTTGTSLSPEADAFLTEYSGDVLEIRVFGGATVVTDAVKNAAAAKIW
ncbi:MAG: cell wall-binding repeat-containing protein [Actinomycetota bacterium]|nr:cell wall-binding repeat-containing protein [Actinomycetota bacterium]